jgi:anti-sigma factor RsiW
MSTDETFLLLNAYCDGELSPGEALEMERRLAADPEPRHTAEKLGLLSAALQDALAVPPAPVELRARIVRQIGFADPPHPATRASWRHSWQALAATFLLGLFGGGLFGGGAAYLAMGEAREPTMEAVLAAHLRGLAAPLPYDVASSDRHVVKPWFNGRTTIAPQTPDLAAQGFPLIGGRIDIVGGEPVPTLVYRRNRHVISVTVVPEKRVGRAGPGARDGSTIERVSAAGLTYWITSDLDRQDLRGFVDMLRAQIVPADQTPRQP